mgnify:CR=1 FL=1
MSNICSLTLTPIEFDILWLLCENRGKVISSEELFEKGTLKPIDHYAYCFTGDGCLMEGVAQEAISVAGNLKLSKLIMLYDKNDITKTIN